jgi:hypothetical protein
MPNKNWRRIVRRLFLPNRLDGLGIGGRLKNAYIGRALLGDVGQVSRWHFLRDLRTGRSRGSDGTWRTAFSESCDLALLTLVSGVGE